MNDLLLEAWGLLTPEERPGGMHQIYTAGFRCYYDGGTYATYPLTDATTRDRLIVACEEVAIKAGHRLHSSGSGYEWETGHYDDPYTTGYSTDRLAAAVAAIRAERRKV